MRGRLAALTLAAGCAPSIAPAPSDGGGDPVARYATASAPDGSFVTVVDATSTEEWIHGDLVAGVEVTADEPWDLRFQRFHISTNGGVTGAAGVAVAVLAGVAFADVAAAPAAGFVADAPDGDDANLEPDYAFEQGDGWYAYDMTTHVLTPRPITYVVRTASGAAVKLEIARYYDDAGTAAHLMFRWAVL